MGARAAGAVGTRKLAGRASAGRLGGFSAAGLRRRVRWALAAGALLAALLVVAPAAEGRGTASLSLNIAFATNGSISVTLPDGTLVGASSGSPTVIPAGFYTLLLTGPGGCFELPYFDLQGPGVSIVDNMYDGEVTNSSDNADFQPNSTYTWRNDNDPAVVYTFQTNSDVEGTPSGYAAVGPGGLSSGNGSTASSSDLVGSAVATSSSSVPFEGTLSASVSAAGKLALSYKGHGVSTLSAGRYAVAVSDKSRSNGFMIAEANHAGAAVSVKGVGTHSASVELTAGQWYFASQLAGKKTYFIVVN